MKHIIILGDGMSDDPVARLGGRTPLQAARKPNMDRLAREGCCGRLRTIEDDMPTGSETANLAVLGYDPRQVLEGRGVLEAASMGVAIEDGEMAMRCNLICLDNGCIKNHSAGHISSEESDALLKAMQSEVGAPGLRFYTGVSYRHLLVARGLDPRLECAPPHDHPGEKAEDLLIRPRAPEAEATARLLNDLTRRSWSILAEHPVNRQRRQAGKDPGNSIWLWSPGRRPRMWTFAERFAVSGAVISAVDLIRGIGVYAGLEPIRVPGATGFWDTNYEGKADACLAALERHDFCYVHVEAPDEAGHDGNLDLKIRTIEDLDARLVGPILSGLDRRGWEAVVAVLPDHPTPVEKRIHVRDPVPFAIRDPRRAPDAVSAFDEASCAAGAFGLLHGDQFIRAVFG
ncbi:MAG TPA: cofactor-independent phosphoglycerate mutase [Candidatus Paceibacterota bacterium]|nr:cofactor-independent phosphoglycerate mutase [Verrucomicrobiota bacterium]HRZ47550.1 cofactor-independent phosphoglycerate mutase [Candidatus Paceibacterota bacterium]HRZ92284.1 cofactor-independent phosphoglycerate mutase [Candidatus Paceibacterota bacterium]